MHRALLWCPLAEKCMSYKITYFYYISNSCEWKHMPCLYTLVTNIGLLLRRFRSNDSLYTCDFVGKMPAVVSLIGAPICCAHVSSGFDGVAVGFIHPLSVFGAAVWPYKVSVRIINVTLTIMLFTWLIKKEWCVELLCERQNIWQ
jgi:hypothetical protein